MWLCSWFLEGPYLSRFREWFCATPKITENHRLVMVGLALAAQMKSKKAKVSCLGIFVIGTAHDPACTCVTG